jgi:hypothetical protein
MKNVLLCMRDWHRQHIQRAADEALADRRRQHQDRRRAPKVKTPASPDELAAIAAISPGNVTYVPATGAKRFARQIQGATELTDSQRIYLWGIVWHFRQQIVYRDLPTGLRLVKIAAKKTQKGAVRC